MFTAAIALSIIVTVTPAAKAQESSRHSGKAQEVSKHSPKAQESNSHTPKAGEAQAPAGTQPATTPVPAKLPGNPLDLTVRQVLSISWDGIKWVGAAFMRGWNHQGPVNMQQRGPHGNASTSVGVPGAQATLSCTGCSK